MKKLYIILFSLFIFLIASNKVMAITEYRIYITGANSIVVKSVNSNTSMSDVSNYSSILSYSNGLLTLNEGYYFDFIDIRYGGATITSNDKKVYINTIGDITNDSNRDVTLDKLYSEPYISSFTPVMYYDYNGKKYIYSSICISGNITIKDSNINMSIVDSRAIQSIQNGNIYSGYGDISIINSTIVAEGGPYADTSKTIFIKDSNLTLTDEHGQGAALSSYYGTTKIENSIIKAEVSVNLYGDDGYIKDSSIEQNNNGMVVFGDSTIDNSYIKSLGIRVYNKNKTINVEFNDSTFDLTQMINIGYSRNSNNYNANLVLNDSNVNLGDDGLIDIVYASSLEMNNSEVNTSLIQSSTGQDSNYLKMNSGILTTNSIDIIGTIDLSNSTLNISEEGFINGNKKVSIKNMNDLNIKSIKGGSVDIDDTNVNLSGALIASDDVDISDSTINTHGTRVVGGFTLTDTYYKTLYLNDENTYSPFIVKGDVDIDNSRLIAVSDGTVPAVLVTGNVTLNEGSTFKDDNRKLLTTSNITVSNDNFLSSSSTYGNAEYVSLGDTVKSTTLNGNLSNYSETDGYYEVIVKVINGSWEDGTVEDSIVKVLLGDDPDAYLPTSMIANKGYKNGSWKVNDDGEYVYTFIKDAIVNPKTRVASLTGLLVISILLIVSLNNYKNNFSLFKNI